MRSCLSGQRPDRRILFIDGSARNVEGARGAGIAAEQWELGHGHDVLLALLAGHGVGPLRPADDAA
jgi:putative hydrolase of the HAD superfamily